MQTASYPAPARAVKPKEIKPLPVGLALQVFDDGSALCPSRTTPGKFYDLRFFLHPSGPVVTECDCPASSHCWHKRALLARLSAPADALCPEPRWVVGQCPCCGGDLVHQSEYRGGRGYALTVRCWGAGAWPAACDYREGGR